MFQKIKEFQPASHGVSHVLWKVQDHYIITSASTVPGYPETYCFRADSEGLILDWVELAGSYRGGLDHERAIAGYAESLT